VDEVVEWENDMLKLCQMLYELDGVELVPLWNSHLYATNSVPYTAKRFFVFRLTT
jgi:hypothetical protein